VGRLLATPAVGLWAALLMAVAQPQIEYSQNARPYAMVNLFLLLAADALLRIVRQGATRRRLAALGVALLVSSLTHYFSLPAIAAMAVYAVIGISASARWKTLGVFAVSGAIALLLWGRQGWAQRANFSDPWSDCVEFQVFLMFR
jgi:uncharacterized membrane protein